MRALRDVIRLLLMCAWLWGCDEGSSRTRGVTCETDFACTLGTIQGRCQSTGFCAYPDDTCADGLRYSPGATDLESDCIGGDACGNAGKPCCEQNVCGANLACSDTGLCSCGGFGEPCCDGATCTGSNTCSAGTCTAGWAQLALGRNFTCGLRTDGVVECWGQNNFRYGIEVPNQQSATISTTTPVVIAGATNVAELKAGEGHACVRKTDGTLWCWGQGGRGQLGNGATANSSVAVQVAGLSLVSKFSVGRQTTCASGKVTGTTGLYCWGANAVRSVNASPSAGRLGNGMVAHASVPTAVDMSQMAASNQTVRAIAVGGYHVCAAMSDNRVWCWGHAQYGNLGNNQSSLSSLAPVLVDLSQITIPTGVTIDEVVAGTSYRSRNSTCMRLSDGVLYCWGLNTDGQAGTGSPGDKLRPDVPVLTTALGGAHFVKVSPVIRGYCGLDSVGKVWCWGDARQGQLGIGTTSTVSQASPVAVVGLPASVTTLATGHRTGCAIDATKRAWCWGSNRRGNITRTAISTVEESVVLQPVEVTP